MSEEKYQWNGEQYAKANSLQMSIGDRLIHSIEVSKQAIVLDAGCGVGNLTMEIARLVPDGKVTAIDLSESMIQEAQNAVGHTGVKNINFQVMGLNEISYNAHFDVIFSNSVMHWVTEIEDAMRRLHTALKSNGQIALQFPLLNQTHPLISYTYRVIDALQLREYYVNWAFPWYVPTEAEFTNTMIKAGFQNVAVRKAVTDFHFASADAVYRHFLSVGLKLFAQALPMDKQEKFMNRVLEEIQDDFSGEAVLKYERLFAYGNAGI